MKKCKGCHEIKSIEKFSLNKHMRDGHLNFCIKCNYIKHGHLAREFVKKDRKIHPEKYKSINFMHIARFGGLRELILERDNYRCVDCGMTDEEHVETWGRHLTLNHIDGTGRNNYDMGLPSNNEINNLESLCLRCHGRKDSLKYWQGRSVII